MTDLIDVTTHSGRLRHLAHPGNLEQREYGRKGHALCDSQIFTDVYDQAAFDEYRMRWNPAYKQVLITSLPYCKRCAKKAGVTP